MILKECCKFQEGYVNPTQKEDKYFDGKIKWLRAIDLNDSHIYETSRNLTEEGLKSAGKSAYLFKPQTLAISKSGTIGSLGILQDYMCGNRAVINIEIDESKVPLMYIFFLLKYKRQEIISKAVGSIQKNLYISSLETIKLCHEDKREMEKIANGLTVIDSKIQLNNKISQELEQMAQTLFNYWFIQFDFPNQAGKPYKATDGKMIYNKALGRDIPEGWSDQNISSLGEIISGGTPKTSCPEYYCEKGIAWITPKDLSNTTDMYISHGERDITEEGLNNSSAKLMPQGSVLLSTRAPIGYLGIAINPVSTNQGFKSIVPKQPYSSEFIYYTLKANVEGISNQGSGTTFQEVSKETLSNFKVICPPEEVLKQYDDIMAPITKKRMLLEAEIKELTGLRDFLLPLLMNEQVKVVEDLYKEDEEMSKILAELRVAEEEVAATKNKEQV